jgi:hypothetical protein
MKVSLTLLEPIIFIGSIFIYIQAFIFVVKRIKYENILVLLCDTQKLTHKNRNLNV